MHVFEYWLNLKEEVFFSLIKIEGAKLIASLIFNPCVKDFEHIKVFTCLTKESKHFISRKIIYKHNIVFIAKKCWCSYVAAQVKINYLRGWMALVLAYFSDYISDYMFAMKAYWVNNMRDGLEI